MEDVIQTYLLPYDPAYPVVCFDEACKQLFGHVNTPRAAHPGADGPGAATRPPARRRPERADAAEAAEPALTNPDKS